MKLRLALLTGLGEPVGPDARAADAVLAFELAEGLLEIARDTGEIEVDLFARRGSWQGLPLVTLDPREVAPPPAHPLDPFAAAEALYTQLVVEGMLRGYDLVHCLAPVIAPLQMLAAMDVPVVQTVTVPPSYPAAKMPPRLIAPDLLRQASAQPQEGAEAIPPGVDTTRFRPLAEPAEDFLLWLGSGPRREAEGIASALALPLRSFRRGDPLPLLQGARALLHLGRHPSPAGPLWPVRALACGTPVAGWKGADLDEVLDRPGLGALASPGDLAGLAAALRDLPDRGHAAPLRRQHVLGRHGRRAMVGRYRELYRELTTKPAL
jgi:hypothetical protein